ncbi:MAG: single-stranded DNA-binding protein [Clostridia bacterium]|nr:single-stranded DNA-binding protein [Clostridia bacterium]
MSNSHNNVSVTGNVSSLPTYSHEVFGEVFYELTLDVQRLSQNTDQIPITVSERLIDLKGITIGSTLGVNGQLRSYNKTVNGKSKLLLSVFAKEVNQMGDDAEHTNSIELTGYICKAPVYRTTPFMREICDLLLAVNRAYSKSDYIPVIAWGRNARFAGSLNIGRQVTIQGRIQSRVYQKRIDDDTIVDKTAFEVSANKITADATAMTDGPDENQSKEPYSASEDCDFDGILAISAQ